MSKGTKVREVVSERRTILFQESPDREPRSPKSPKHEETHDAFALFVEREAMITNARGDFEILEFPDPAKDLPLTTVRIRKHDKTARKTRQVCYRSFFIFPITSTFRQQIILFVEWKWFDRFILSLIALSSIMEAGYSSRAENPKTGNVFNGFKTDFAEPVLTVLFTFELILKVIAYGVFLEKNTYLRDLWNWLDFVVVVTAWVELLKLANSGLSFLRLFRVLRPLRSLNAVPQMKILVNTALKAIPRLNYVAVMGMFLFLIFGIIGITLLEGIFYRACRATPHPVLFRSDVRRQLAVAGSGWEDGLEQAVVPYSELTSLVRSGVSLCWDWLVINEDRLCGGRYKCEDGGYCGGHTEDRDYGPTFPSGQQDLPWCEDSAQDTKVFPETDFIHFDHIGGALLIVFQSMTLEGWTDIMYWVQDAMDEWFGTLYFISVVPLTSFFLLNVALAVVDETLDMASEDDAKDLEDDPQLAKAREQAEADWQNIVDDGDVDYWWDCKAVRLLKAISESEAFIWFIMLFILLNVVTMCLVVYPAQTLTWWFWSSIQECLSVCEWVFLVIFSIEMVVLIGALGPKKYILTLSLAFDGLIVLVSLVEKAVGGGSGAFIAFRTLRLFRVINKLSSRIQSFRVLLKAMIYTAISLNYWLVLFLLVLYIFTLVAMQLFARKFHFNDPDSFDAVTADNGENWCKYTATGMLAENQKWYFKQDCIPRAHFDHFLWAFVTIFQIMTGENWNTVMYAGMRSSDPGDPANWWWFSFFVFLILFGQTLFVSLFVSMLMLKFSEAEEGIKKEESDKAAKLRGKKKSISFLDRTQKGLTGSLRRVTSRIVMIASGDELDETAPDRKLTQTTLVESPSPQHTEDSHQESYRSVIRETCSKLDAEADEDHMSPLPGQLDEETWRINAPSLAMPLEDLILHAPPDTPSPGIPPPPVFTPTAPKALEPTKLPEIPPIVITPAQKTCPELPVHQHFEIDPDQPLVQEKQKWPKGYAFFILHETNPLRRSCRWLMTKNIRITTAYKENETDSVWLETKEVQKERVWIDFNAFDNFILLCIFCSTCCMAMDTPLADPHAQHTKLFRLFDKAFAIIFIIEMFVKLIAFGLFFAHDGYLKSGWNWLDGVIVTVSLADLIMPGSGGFLKVMRILRAFRPLRVISRNQGLKLVVCTIFKSLPQLGTLMAVATVFLVIFSLFSMQYFNGMFYACRLMYSEDTAMPFEDDFGTIGLLRQLGTDFVTPLCLAMPTASRDVTQSACKLGTYNPTNESWDGQSSCAAGSCGKRGYTFQWQRASADTPICVGRCDPFERLKGLSPGLPPTWLCPSMLTSTEQLPPSGLVEKEPIAKRAATPEVLAAEAVGINWRSKMLRQYVMPCAGTVINDDTVTSDAEEYSCAKVFCPEGISPELEEQCWHNCKKDANFCTDVCPSMGSESDWSPTCLSCRKECQAACTCKDYCTPLIKDAAACHEQGSKWENILSQNFDNFLAAMMTLFEISTTEGWVDVMYAACDSEQHYIQPRRDSNQWYAIFFVVYIFFSFMFIINLSVGVIVDNFLSLKKDGKLVLLTPAQRQWVNAQFDILQREHFYNLCNLQELSKPRRKVYEIISSSKFEYGVLTAICVNTAFMACKSFPMPTEWWEDTLAGINLFFLFVFTVEMILKLFALRWNYFKDHWNQFDFICVWATIAGLILKFAFGLNFAAVTSVVRIFRVARLFRLLKYLKDLQKIFMALVLAIPKLMNVGMIWLLILILFSILGVSLFSTAKKGDTLNLHGNFDNFFRAMTTLFRASTGEAWNEIMHDLGNTEKTFLQKGSWCSPPDLFDPSIPCSSGNSCNCTGDDCDTYKWDILKEKGLVAEPNACVKPIFGVNLWPYLFWTVNILCSMMMMMNLVIAVILEGYEDGKTPAECEMIEDCMAEWRKFDVNQTEYLPFKQVFEFLDICTKMIAKSRGWPSFKVPMPNIYSKAGRSGCFDCDIECFPMKLAKCFQMKVLPDGKVHISEAVQQVLVFVTLGDDAERIHELSDQAVEKHIDVKAQQKLQKMKSLRFKKLYCEASTKSSSQVGHTSSTGKVSQLVQRHRHQEFKPIPLMDLRSTVAAIKLQRMYRRRKARSFAGLRALHASEKSETSTNSKNGEAIPRYTSSAPDISPGPMSPSIEPESSQSIESEASLISVREASVISAPDAKRTGNGSTAIGSTANGTMADDDLKKTCHKSEGKDLRTAGSADLEPRPPG